MGWFDFLKRKPKQADPPPTAAQAPTAPAPAITTRNFKPPEPRPAPPPAPVDSPFLPIGRVELMKNAEDVRRTTGWMLFGRRDLIPPTSDARTLLIDRGMVSQGFATAEQLAEWHAIGDAHAKFANREWEMRRQAGQSAEEAVAADRAARVEAKVRKKAEAAAKRKARADEVAKRKATDIIFVGKGVSGRMNDRGSDYAKLAAAGLPVVHSPAGLALVLGLTVPKLRWLCFHTEVASRTHYIYFEVPKKSGGVRALAAPHKSLAKAQRWILDSILSKLPTEAPAHGFVPGRSILTNALPHTGKDVVLNLDLEQFFPSIDFARVQRLFRRLGYSGAVATLLALLCTECPRRRVVYDGVPYFVATGPRALPQGACTSPAISNQVARRLDKRLAGLAKKLELTYTRYADDLTFSGTTDKIGYVIARVRHIAGDEGFAVNAKKTRARRRNTRQAVTGLVVNGSPAPPREMIRRVRAILHHAKAEGLAAQNREGLPDFHAWLEGMIAYIAMSKPEAGAKLRKAMMAL